MGAGLDDRAGRDDGVEALRERGIERALLEQLLLGVEDDLFPRVEANVLDQLLARVEAEILDVLLRSLDHRTHGVRGSDVTGTQGGALPDHRGRVGGSDRVAPVDREGVARVVHDRPVVVGADVVAVRDVLVEVADRGRLDLGPVDRDERVAVFATLFMPEPDDVADLVDRVSRRASGCEVHELLASLTPDGRRAPAPRPKRDEVRLGRPRDEPETRARLPVRDRIRHPSLIGKGGVDRERDDTVRPAKLRPGAEHAGLELPPHHAPELLRLLVHLLDGAEHDVALEESEPVSHDVLHGLSEERRAGDQAGANVLAREQLTRVRALLRTRGAATPPRGRPPCPCHGVSFRIPPARPPSRSPLPRE